MNLAREANHTVGRLVVLKRAADGIEPRPQPVRQRIEAAPIVGRQKFSFGIDVGDIGDRNVAEAIRSVCFCSASQANVIAISVPPRQ